MKLRPCGIEVECQTHKPKIKGSNTVVGIGNEGKKVKELKLKKT